MKEDIYIAIIETGFTAKTQNRESNKSQGIARAYTDENERLIEVYKEEKNLFHVMMYGDGFMNDIHPTKKVITCSEDIEDLKSFIENIKYQS